MRRRRVFVRFRRYTSRNCASVAYGIASLLPLSAVAPFGRWSPPVLDWGRKPPCRVAISPCGYSGALVPLVPRVFGSDRGSSGVRSPTAATWAGVNVSPSSFSTMMGGRTAAIVASRRSKERKAAARAAGASAPAPRAPASASASPVPAAIQEDSAVVAQLMELSFGHNSCRRAVLATNSNLEAASNWLMEHAGDADFDEPLMVVAAEPAPSMSFTSQSATDTSATPRLREPSKRTRRSSVSSWSSASATTAAAARRSRRTTTSRPRATSNWLTEHADFDEPPAAVAAEPKLPMSFTPPSAADCDPQQHPRR